MKTLAELLREGPLPGPHDVARITALLAEQVRYGHDQGAVHGDLGPETVRLERRGSDWAVRLDQPRPGGPAGSWRAPELGSGAASPAADIYSIGRIVQELAEAVPGHELPPSVAAAVRSMTAADPAARPSISQVALYFGEDLPAELDGPVGEETIMVPRSEPYQEPVAEDGYSGSAAPLAAWDEDDTDAGYAVPVAGEERGGAGRAAILVSVLVLALGLGSLGFTLWRTLGGDDRPVTAVQDPPRTEAEATQGDPPGDDAELVTATQEEPEPTGTAPTGEETAEEAEEAEEIGADATSDDEELPGSGGTASTDSSDDGTTTPALETSSDYDHKTPYWGDHGWDEDALDAAYCRDGSYFTGLADTETYRGVICMATDGSYRYRGLNKAGNATLLSLAYPTTEGWEAYGSGGVRYAFDEDTFAILDGDGDVLDEEDVVTWLMPTMTPFRPGDLDLDQQISYPACDGSGVVVLASHSDPATNQREVQRTLDANPGSFYVRTDLSCDNFNRPARDTTDENYIYAVLAYGGNTRDELCAAIEEYGASYGYFLAEDVEPGQAVSCN